MSSPSHLLGKGHGVSFKAVAQRSAIPPLVVGRTFINLRPVAPRSYPDAPYAQLSYSPENLSPMVPGASPSEGTWSPLGTNLGPGYAMFSTFVQPTASSPSVGVVWINPVVAKLSIYAGTTQPGGNFPTMGAVSPLDQPSLLAAFEGGFQFNVANGGFFQAGKTGAPLVTGAATIAQYADGTIDIGSWGSEIVMNPSVVALRQNLTLLVDNRALTSQAQADNLNTWGYSLGNLLSTWRSGIGVTANGDVIWVGGPGLSPLTLAQTLLWAGAIRGMQLDINPDWVSFATFSSTPAGTSGSNLMGNMYFPASHYLTPFWRDFIAVFRRPAP
ncbi:MAG: hypothetical protein ACP5PJ_07835 [Acidimicrobiales bacterium]